MSNSMKKSFTIHDLPISERPRAEAADGGEQEIAYKRGRQTRKLLVKIPAGVKAGTRIRLKGMGLARKSRTGDLYLEVIVRD